MTTTINTLNAVDKRWGPDIMVTVEKAVDKLLSSAPAGWVKTFDHIQDSSLNLRLTKVTMAIADRIVRENRESELTQRQRTVSTSMVDYIYLHENRVHEYCEQIEGLCAEITRERTSVKITIIYKSHFVVDFSAFADFGKWTKTETQTI